MEACQCTSGSMWYSNKIAAKVQFYSDMLICMGYLLIPLELAFLARAFPSLAPYRMILLQFGAFVILCGTTHFLNVWAFSGSTGAIDTAQAVAKLLCAFVSCATAISLFGIIRNFLA